MSKNSTQRRKYGREGFDVYRHIAYSNAYYSSFIHDRCFNKIAFIGELKALPLSAFNGSINLNRRGVKNVGYIYRNTQL
jgi:hypothetical protein